MVVDGSKKGVAGKEANRAHPGGRAQRHPGIEGGVGWGKLGQTRSVS